MNHHGLTSPTTELSRWHLNSQLLRLPSSERRQLIEMLQRLQVLDQSLGELHLTLPTIKVQFYGLPRGVRTLYSAEELLRHLD